MIEQAGERRNKGQKNLQDRQWSVMMSPEWINELLKHDFVSGKLPVKIRLDKLFHMFNCDLIPIFYIDKKGRGSSSILISTLGQARM